MQCVPAFPLQTNTSAMLRCHIYDNQSIIHLLGLPLPCVDPTAMLPAHIWLHGVPLSPGWDLPLVMGHLGGQMNRRLCFVYYGYGALWRHWQLHIDSLLSRRPSSAVVLFLLFRTLRKKRQSLCYRRFSVTPWLERMRKDHTVFFFCWKLNLYSLVINLLMLFNRMIKCQGEASGAYAYEKKNIFSNYNLLNIRYFGTCCFPTLRMNKIHPPVSIHVSKNCTSTVGVCP